MSQPSENLTGSPLHLTAGNRLPGIDTDMPSTQASDDGCGNFDLNIVDREHTQTDASEDESSGSNLRYRPSSRIWEDDSHSHPRASIYDIQPVNLQPNRSRFAGSFASTSDSAVVTPRSANPDLTRAMAESASQHSVTSRLVRQGRRLTTDLVRGLTKRDKVFRNSPSTWVDGRRPGTPVPGMTFVESNLGATIVYRETDEFSVARGRTSTRSATSFDPGTPDEGHKYEFAAHLIHRPLHARHDLSRSTSRASTNIPQNNYVPYHLPTTPRAPQGNSRQRGILRAPNTRTASSPEEASRRYMHQNINIDTEASGSHRIRQRHEPQSASSWETVDSQFADSEGFPSSSPGIRHARPPTPWPQHETQSASSWETVDSRLADFGRRHVQLDRPWVHGRPRYAGFAEISPVPFDPRRRSTLRSPTPNEDTDSSEDVALDWNVQFSPSRARSWETQAIIQANAATETARNEQLRRGREEFHWDGSHINLVREADQRNALLRHALANPLSRMESSVFETRDQEQRYIQYQRDLTLAKLEGRLPSPDGLHSPNYATNGLTRHQVHLSVVSFYDLQPITAAPQPVRPFVVQDAIIEWETAVDPSFSLEAQEERFLGMDGEAHHHFRFMERHHAASQAQHARLYSQLQLDHSSAPGAMPSIMQPGAFDAPEYELADQKYGDEAQKLDDVERTPSPLYTFAPAALVVNPIVRTESCVIVVHRPVAGDTLQQQLLRAGEDPDWYNDAEHHKSS